MQRAEEPALKKQKQDAQEQSPAPKTQDPASVFSPQLMTPESRASLRTQYQQAQPYLHGVLRELLPPETLAQVRDEIVGNIQATYKETDLLKVFQTGDLGNLDRLDAEAASKLPTLMKLKSALYSETFRGFVRDVTGCGELSDRTDCSCNVYAKGGHLLCHDDVIGTRRVSYIIYLTDPEDPWTPQDGGNLELYPLVEGSHHTPAVHPSVCHLPTFNTMVMFTVLPGRSFHAVQEVFASDKPRMSISGWYHGPAEPEGLQNASLQQLQRHEGQAGNKQQQQQQQEGQASNTPEQQQQQQQGAQAQPLSKGADLLAASQYLPFGPQGDGAGAREPGSSGQPSTSGDTHHHLSDDDLSFLIRYMNPTYLSESAWSKIQGKFKEDGSVQLKGFLKKSLADRIGEAMAAEDAADKLGAGKVPAYEAGVHGGWEPQGPPHKQRYLAYKGEQQGRSAPTGGSNPPSSGALLAQVRDELFASPAFARFLNAITTITMIGQRGEVRRFRPGLDYTVAHYGIVTQDPRLDAVLCFVAEREGDTTWDDGEVGGFEAYLLADEEKEGAAAEEVYRQDTEESGVLNVSAAFNSLNLVLRDEGLMKFVKYLSADAPSSRWDIAMEYLPEDDSDEEGDEGQKAGEKKTEGQH
ncbi:Oxoglutarate and iron-dependent oxygenase degradation C-term-domain-containing protein [Dunaliella salina]|uniref:Oxoglutarate and iron-dependent oxygenase degradation C-term-domain-containing protein n=1 Tax=Dunaliella salina TaxID=3046 RepID=A0ABQ7H7X4_DUNSA|nr:Oxoglutarate and iron-dependent oxygenase degradation C-term-domain-containing protein [Dunaliella salina]|eukprot:KAF5842957.1 Oxoglutarate and iron-dependent oxygenase degradation C-term-domain-containing protein [Dunaliella salina]